MLKETDHRIYKDDEGTPTIQMGCGGIIVSDMYCKNGTYSGVCFTLGEGEIGDSHDYQGQTAGQIGAFLKIAATKPESLQILINKLELAMKNFGRKGTEIKELQK